MLLTDDELVLLVDAILEESVGIGDLWESVWSGGTDLRVVLNLRYTNSGWAADTRRVDGDSNVRVISLSALWSRWKIVKVGDGGGKERIFRGGFCR
jgi:hypothetical protein